MPARVPGSVRASRLARTAPPLASQGGWRLQFVIADKLKRPITWAGDVRSDEYRGVAIEGTVFGPPRRGQDPGSGGLMGEFRGWKLE